MEDTLLQFATTQGPAIAILSIGGYFLVKYFMGQIDKKDANYREEISIKEKQNQANLDRYINLSEKNMEVMSKFSGSLDGLHPKLNDIHEDIKIIKDRK